AAIQTVATQGRVCIDKLQSNGFFGTLDCLVATARAALASAGEAAVDELLSALLNSPSGDIMRGLFVSVKSRLLAGYKALTGETFPPEVVKVLEKEGADLLKTFASAAV